MQTIEVVAAVIQKGGLFFATERGYGEFRGFWEFPGGKVEPGETFEAALVREIAEELSVQISVEKYLCTVEYDYPRFHLKMHGYLCAIREGSPVLLEHLAAKWLKKSELQTVEWLPADWEMVNILLSDASV